MSSLNERMPAGCCHQPRSTGDTLVAKTGRCGKTSVAGPSKWFSVSFQDRSPAPANHDARKTSLHMRHSFARAERPIWFRFVGSFAVCVALCAADAETKAADKQTLNVSDAVVRGAVFANNVGRANGACGIQLTDGHNNVAAGNVCLA